MTPSRAYLNVTTHHAAPAPHAAAPFAAADQSLLLNLQEVAEQLRCTRRNVERLVAAHELPVVRFGRSVRIERTAVERFVAEHREAG
ncbi:MAG: binding domain protein excisionase family [Nocardioides sp.]|nr:binding domain protein excisionase family [Nocardioides sp.]